MMPYRVRLWGGLGDGFLHMYTRKPHLIVESVRKNDPTRAIVVEVISNNKDLVELYRYNPLITDITYSPQTPYIIAHEALDISYDENLNQYYDSLPNFYLNPSEQKLVNDIIAAGPYIFMHPYSSTPRKKIAYYLKLQEIVDFIIDRLHLNVVFFGKSHVFDPHSHQRGYPSCIEQLDYTRPGLYNFSTTSLLDSNNPRLGWHLLRSTKWALLAESAYLQPATYLGSKVFVIVGHGMEQEYKANIHHEYFKALRVSTNNYIPVEQFNLTLLEKFNGS